MLLVAEKDLLLGQVLLDHPFLVRAQRATGFKLGDEVSQDVDALPAWDRLDQGDVWLRGLDLGCQLRRLVDPDRWRHRPLEGDLDATPVDVKLWLRGSGMFHLGLANGNDTTGIDDKDLGPVPGLSDVRFPVALDPVHRVEGTDIGSRETLASRPGHGAGTRIALDTDLVEQEAALLLRLPEPGIELGET